MSEKFTQAHVGLLAVLVTVIFGVMQYWQSLRSHHEQTINHVFEISKEYRDDYLDVKMHFWGEWTAYTNSFHAIPAAEVTRQYPELVEKFLAKEETLKEYEKLSYFYNMVGQCVKAELCDFNSANLMFGDDMLTFYHNMYPDLISVRRTGYSASGIFDFIAKKKAVRP